MAVALVAVEMGPRKRRRLWTSAITVAVVGSILALLLLLFNRSTGRSNTAPTDRTNQVIPAKATGHLTFGMTQPQVRDVTGRPTQSQGNCWLFHPSKTGLVGSISVQPSFATVPYDPLTTGNLKLCFFGGAYSYAFLRVFIPNEHKWEWTPWPLTLSPSR